MLDSNTLTIIFGLSSGILSLVGLTAIFISFNSQHSIQKGRELLWNIISFPLDIKDYSREQNAKTLCHYYWLYKDIIRDSGGFTRKIVLLSQFAILIVCGFWIIGIFLYSYFLDRLQITYILIATVVSIIILLRYGWILGKLSCISKISNLPEYDSLLDANVRHDFNINITALAGIGSTLKITKKGDTTYRISIGMALPFINLSAIPKVFAFNTEIPFADSVEPIYCEEFKAFSIDGRGYLSLGSDIWYNLIEISINEDTRNQANIVDFQLDFSCSQSYSLVKYSISMVDLIKIGFGESEYLLPNYMGASFVTCEDGTIVPWGLNV